MKHPLMWFWVRWVAIIVMVCSSFLSGAPALAYENPALLPKEFTPVVDLAKVLTNTQTSRLVESLTQFEQETGWKLRILTQFEQTPGRAVINYWNLDDKSILLVADGKGGNLLSFSVGDAVYELLPRTFWIELQARYGNMYFVRDNGEEQSIVQSLEAVKTCLVQEGGCGVVPGLPQEQWVLTLATSIIGGLIFGFAGRPRKPNQVFAWQWALIFSPLWGMLFISFGLGPVLVRTSDWLPLVRNISGFVVGALAAYLTHFVTTPTTPSET
jgi:energy-converting hydrogenase Eha subunit A